MKSYQYINPSIFPYIKTDNGLVYKPEVVFSCRAENIEQADLLAEKAGLKPKLLECQFLIDFNP